MENTNYYTTQGEEQLTLKEFSKIQSVCILNIKKQLYYMLFMKIAIIKKCITSVFNICLVIIENQDLLSIINLTECSTIDFYLGVFCSYIGNFNNGRVKIFYNQTRK